MSFERVLPVEKRRSRSIPGEAYVTITPKMLYISASAWKMFGAEYITIDLDTKSRIIRFRSAETPQKGTTFKLSRVKETPNARRIETNNALMSLVAAGLPRAALRKHLPCTIGLDGSLLVDYAYHPAPAICRERVVERGGDIA